MDGADIDEDINDGAPPRRRRGGLLAAVALAAAATGGVTYAFTAGVPERVAQAMAARKVAKAEKMEAEKAAHRVIVSLDPIVVSLPAEGQIRRNLPRLSVAIALETSDPELAESMRPRLRNDFIAAMRAVDAATLRSPDGLETLRGTLAERSEEVLGDSFHQLLITEFIVL